MINTDDLPSYYPGYDDYCEIEKSDEVLDLEAEKERLQDMIQDYEIALCDIDCIINDDENIKEIKSIIDTLKEKGYNF